MFVDHLGVYVFAPTAASEAAGALTLPLFVAAFAGGLARRSADYGWTVLPRLVRWAVVAQLFGLAVGREHPNVLFTFVLGLSLFLVVRRSRIWECLLCTTAVAGAAYFVEFQWAGVGFVASALWFLRGGSVAALVVLAACLGGLVPYNGSQAALAAVPLVVAVSCLPADLPRVRGVMYRVYAFQWPALAMLREVLR